MATRGHLVCGMLCALFLARHASAQAFLYAGIDSDQAWVPPYPPEGDFRGLWACRLDGDELIDAVVLDGERAVFFRSPGQDHRYAEFSAVARALVPWPATLPLARDRVLVSEPDRLVVHTFGPVPSASPSAHLAKVVPGGELAGGARSLEILAAGATSWLAGLADDGRTLFLGELVERKRRKVPAGTAELGYLETTRFTLSEDVLAWELLQWDGQGPPELATQTVNAIEIRTSDAGLAFGVSVPAPGSPVLERFRDAAYPADRLFLIVPDGQGVPYGFLLDQRYANPFEPLLEPGFLFVDVGEVGIDDYDGDGLGDLWVTMPYMLATESLTLGNSVLFHGSAEPLFPSESTFSYDPGKTSFFDLRGLAPGSPPTSAPLGDCGDFDLDGDLDFLFVSDDYDHLNFVRGDAVDEEAFVPVIHDFTFSDEGGVFTFLLDMSVPLTAPVIPGGAPAFLTLDVHYQPQVGAQIEAVARLSPATFTIPLESNLVPLSFPTAGDSPLAVYQFRFRVLDADGRQLGPPLIEYFTDSAKSFVLLASEPNPWGREPIDSGGNGFHRRAVVGPLCLTCPQ